MSKILRKKLPSVAAGRARTGLTGENSAEFWKVRSMTAFSNLFSDGSHGTHNKECNDNLGPVVVSRKQK